MFLNRPVDLLNSLHCKVAVSSARGYRVSGGLLAVDPVTDTAVIVDTDNSDAGDINNYPVTIVPLVRWDDMEIVDSSEVYKELVRNIKFEQSDKCDMSEEETEAARDKVTAWLAKNGLEAVVKGSDVVIADAVIMEAPFTAESCSATNEIILARVQDIVRRVPG